MYKRQHPYRSHLTGMFYQGQQGKPLAIVVPGGGFISNVTDCEGYPVAMKLHKMGYSVFVVSYPVGRQLGETEQVKQGQAAARELTQVIRYLTEHQKQFSVNMDDYAIFGFSAGGLMTTAYSFANYEDCCHKNHLPRPKVIFPMYGLDWNIKALQEDVYKRQTRRYQPDSLQSQKIPVYPLSSPFSHLFAVSL